jgi:hypothetical protein
VQVSLQLNAFIPAQLRWTRDRFDEHVQSETTECPGNEPNRHRGNGYQVAVAVVMSEAMCNVGKGCDNAELCSTRDYFGQLRYSCYLARILVVYQSKDLGVAPESVVAF